MSEELAKILDELALRYGTTVGELWEVMVRQQVNIGVSRVIFWTVALVGCFLVIQLFRRFHVALKERANGETYWDCGENDLLLGGCYLAYVVTSIFVLCSLDGIRIGILYIINPTFYAIRAIIG